MSASSSKASSSARYGWVIVVMSAWVMLATLPGRTHGLGLITEPLLKDLHIDRVDFAKVNLWATLFGAVFCLPTGWAIDRFGLRFITMSMLLATGWSALALSHQKGVLWMLLLVMTLTRGFGQSALSVCSITAVGKWFRDRAGMAMGVYAFLIGLFFAVAFGVLGKMVREHGWRAAWTAVAMVLIFAAAPLALLLMRDPPIKTMADESVGSADGLSLAESARTPVFWIFAGSTALFGLVSSGLGLFQQAVLEERGFDQTAYHQLLVGTALISLLAQLLSGWLSLRHSISRLTGVAMFLQAVALGWLPFIKASWALWGFAILMGISGGIITVAFFAIWGQAFGRAHLGRIQAAAQTLTVFTSAVGPLIFAKCQAVTGSYSPILLGLAPVCIGFGVAAWGVVLPKPQTQACLLETVPAKT